MRMIGDEDISIVIDKRTMLVISVEITAVIEYGKTGNRKNICQI